MSKIFVAEPRPDARIRVREIVNRKPGRETRSRATVQSATRANRAQIVAVSSICKIRPEIVAPEFFTVGREGCQWNKAIAYGANVAFGVD